MDSRLSNFVFGFALALMVGWVLYIGRGILVPIVVSIFIAYILVAFARLLARVPVIGPLLPGWVRFLIAIAAVALGVLMLVALVGRNVDQVLAKAPEYQATLTATLTGLAVNLGIETEPTWETLRGQLLSWIDLQALLGSTVASLSALLGNIFVIIIYTAFLLIERRQFAAKLEGFGDDRERRRRIGEMIAAVNDRIGDYLALKTFVNLMLGVLSWLIMLAIGIDFAGFWAVWIGLANYVPYVGSFVGVAFPVTLALVQFGSFGPVFAALAGLTVAQLLVGSVLEPRLMGRALNLSPFVILVALTTWYALWGIVGALMSVPITAIMVIAFAEFQSTRPIAALLSSRGRI